mmetsp:Transcript_170/g.224  ORF Transcript_170/g.224 Transcript_170/m.224 type:complete len:109 (-) Transcript_170:126-452(-)
MEVGSSGTTSLDLSEDLLPGEPTLLAGSSARTECKLIIHLRIDPFFNSFALISGYSPFIYIVSKNRISGNEVVEYYLAFFWRMFSCRGGPVDAMAWFGVRRNEPILKT